MSQSRFYGKKLGRPTDHLHSSSLILNGFTVAYFCRSKARLSLIISRVVLKGRQVKTSQFIARLS